MCLFKAPYSLAINFRSKACNRCPAFYSKVTLPKKLVCLNPHIWAVPSCPCIPCAVTAPRACLARTAQPHEPTRYPWVDTAHSCPRLRLEQSTRQPPQAKAISEKARITSSNKNNFKYLSGTYSAEGVSCCSVSWCLSHNKTCMAFQLDGRYWSALSPIFICNPGSHKHSISSLAC